MRTAEERAEWGRIAEAEVVRRVSAATDRLNVVLQFDRGSAAVVSQTLHALHWIERGWASNSVEQLDPDAPDFQVDRATAEQLLIALVSMLAEARRAEWLVRDAE
jgi:hypothetical protein